MKIATLPPMPSLTDIADAERTATVKLLLSLCQQQQEQLALQSEQIQQLKDEIAVLKGQKPRPPLKPSGLNKPLQDSATEGEDKPPRKRGKPVRKKTQDLAIHQEQLIEPEELLRAGARIAPSVGLYQRLQELALLHRQYTPHPLWA